MSNVAVELSFAALKSLLATNPKAYEREVKRLRSTNPARLDAYVGYLTRFVNTDRAPRQRERRHSSMHRFLMAAVDHEPVTRR